MSTNSLPGITQTLAMIRWHLLELEGILARVIVLALVNKLVFDTNGLSRTTQ
jgi:hypothetical protein